MKKRILTFMLATMMLFSVAQCVSAEVYLPNAKGSYVVEYEDAKIVDGEQYGFVVIEGLDNAVLDLSDDNLESVLYINQAEGDAGSITFDEFGLKGKLPTEDGFVGGTAFIGGKGFSTATTIGTLEAPGVAVTGITLDKTTAAIKVGETVTLKATVTPDNATNKTVTWTSSDSTVATVDANGVVTGVKASDKAITITAKAGDKTATCTVTVSAAAANVPGDVNKDGDLNIFDIMLVCQKIAGQSVNVDVNVGDVNKDGDLNIFDIMLMCQKIAGHDVTLK